jgi:hypothetical protein
MNFPTRRAEFIREIHREVPLVMLEFFRDVFAGSQPPAIEFQDEFIHLRIEFHLLRVDSLPPGLIDPVDRLVDREPMLKQQLEVHAPDRLVVVGLPLLNFELVTFQPSLDGIKATETHSTPLEERLL